METAQERFNEKYIVDKNGCHIWQDHRNQGGYGRFWLDGKGHYAHRVAYIWEYGPIPEGLQCDHLCRVRVCCNPKHIELVTQQENFSRGNGGIVGGARERAKTHCPYGHEYTSDNTYIQPSRGSRICRTCRKEYSLKWRALKKADAMSELQ